MMGARQESGSI